MSIMEWFNKSVGSNDMNMNYVYPRMVSPFRIIEPVNDKEYKIKYQNGIAINEDTCSGDGMEVESGLLFITNRHCRVAAYQVSSIIKVSSIDIPPGVKGTPEG